MQKKMKKLLDKTPKQIILQLCALGGFLGLSLAAFYHNYGIGFVSIGIIFIAWDLS